MFDELRELIQRSNNIVFFGGAGVSTESGIPDFRSENGLYKAKTQYGKSPEELLDIDFFYENPKIFYDYYKKNLIAKDAKPNKAHIALAKLEEQGKLKAVITQNIDGLHQLAGSKNVLELHGSVQRNHCLNCGKSFDLDYIMDEQHCKEGVPHCDDCKGLIKPDVVLYGENLDDRCIRKSINAIQKAEVLIIGGTSLVVYPAAGFVRFYKGNKLVLINLSDTDLDEEVDILIHSPIGKVLAECIEL